MTDSDIGRKTPPTHLPPLPPVNGPDDTEDAPIARANMIRPNILGAVCIPVGVDQLCKTPPIGLPPSAHDPPSVQMVTPSIPTEFPAGTILAIHIDADRAADTNIKVVTQFITVPKVDFSSFTASDTKIFYLETHELSSRLLFIKALVADMKTRSTSLGNSTIDSSVEALERIVISAASAADSLYAQTADILYPSSGEI